MTAETTKTTELTPFEDLISAREAARIFTRKEVHIRHLRPVVERLKLSGFFGIKIVADLLENMQSIEGEARMLVVNLAAFFLLSDVPKANETLVGGVAFLLNYSDTAVRERALATLLALGTRATMAQDFALGCIRNSDAQIRLGGARLLNSLGTVCSRNFAKQIKSAIERYPDDAEFCNYLQATINILQ